MRKLLSVFIILSFLVSMCGCVDLEEINSHLDRFQEKIPQEVYIIETEKVEAINVEPQPLDENDLKHLYCFAQLSKEQKRIYQIMLKAVKTMQTGWISLEKCNKDYDADIAVAYQALSNDNPELFWMPYNYLLSNSGSKNSPKISIAFSITQGEHSCDYLVSSDKKEEMEAALNKKVDELINKTKGLTIYSTELFLHDYICESTTYTMGEYHDLVFTSYGALVKGEAVCEGYSRAMQLLCKRLGIPCTLVTGVADGEGHMWNVINPGDGWYNLDLTWDDGSEDNIPLYSYFNVTDEQIKHTHTASTHFSKILSETITQKRNFNIVDPHCTKTAYNYFIHEGLVFSEDYVKKVADGIMLADDQDKKQLQFRFSTKELADKFNSDYQNYVSDIQLYLFDILGSGAPQIENIAMLDMYVTLYWK